MAEVKWIKIVTDIFDDEKILMIEALPSADSLIVIWFKLLCMAGKSNNDGVFLMNNKIPYTDEMLAAIFRRDINIVKMALSTFENYGMIEIVDDVITIPNWNKHQTLDSYERKKERDKIYQQERRCKQKALVQESSDSRLTIGDSSSDVVISEEEKEEDKEIEVDKEVREKIDYQKIVDLYNTLCPSFPSVTYLSENRRKAIKARLNTYKIEDFEAMFKKAQESSFLKGGNGRSWIANFDWMLKDANMAKILDGNYADKSKHTDGQKPPLNRTAQELDDFYTMAADWAQKGD